MSRIADISFNPFRRKGILRFIFNHFYHLLYCVIILLEIQKTLSERWVKNII
ncbi:Uncharacterized protein dnm_076060 [Desulfonema magnum]|uniref:Uncharacterized protein n=1 Tax=Desulfonema magnum TaxID=45655 RepID=A0A975BUG3_9BACT|nr:Uncharacterized protein dnm_076060 [Desulfonema magnum]